MKILKTRFIYLLGLVIYTLLICSCSDTEKVSSNDENPTYLNAEASIDDRINDLMARMTLEDKVYQMCQYVGLEHMKAAESKISPEELEKNDALGFYPAGPVVLVLGSFIWLIVSCMWNEPALIVTNLTLALVGVAGLLYTL